MSKAENETTLQAESRFSGDANWVDRRMVAFDLETTGVDLNEARIVQAAISWVGGDQLPEHHEWLVNPGVPIPEAAAAIHGISDERVQADGQDAKQAINEIVTHLRRAVAQKIPIVVFNARFDITILERECRRYQISSLHDRGKVYIIDPMVIDRQLDRYRSGKRKLENLCEHYRVPFKTDDAHDACVDAIATARLAWRMGKEVPEMQVDLDELTRRQEVWAEKSAQSLQRFFKENGRSDRVQIEWPLVPEESV